MTHRVSIKYFLAFLIGFSLILLTAIPTATQEGGVFLKVYELKVSPKKSHLTRNLISCNVDNTNSENYGKIGTKLPASVTYRVNPSSAPSSVSSNLSTIVSNSFNTWDAVTNGVILTRGSNTSVNRARFDSQNVVAWGRLSRSTLGATYIWYRTSTGEVIEVDTIMNSRQPWSWTNPATVDEDQFCPSTSSYDAQNILVHELGHWVGLDDLYDSEDEDLTMYGFGDKQELKKDTLDPGDINGANAIYP